ncbi:aspartate/glutamate racemase family protein [Bradyrhizobium sp.]|uniref:aspartate/glutamate racemase family protein n=1 Tax=Bradyrhizobium sp. TaxID=376 RepID=UPI003C174F3B
MRILLINPNTTTSVTDLITQYVRPMVGENDEIVPVTGRFGARYISTRAAAAIAAHAGLDLLASHVQGCDAVYLACFGDPGLLALREVSPVPVIGMAEASCHAACARGDRFGIVTGGALWKPMLTEFVATLGLADRFAGVQTIAPTGDLIANDPDAALADLARACEACRTQGGADVVILGGAALAGLAARLQPGVSIPLLCSVETGMQAVISAARQPRQGSQRERGPVKTIGLSAALETLLGATSN